MIEESKILEVVKSSHCHSDVLKKLNLSVNGTGFRLLTSLIQQYSIDVSHFDIGFKNRKYKKIEKACPVCGKLFTAFKNHPNEKMTCSFGCANTFFRSGKRHKEDSECRYFELCWRYHKKICVVCGECLIVEAHHYNGKHVDNRPENFAPLCPTHHQYWHSKHRALIQEKVDSYVKKWISERDI
jgi:hypothetical protein